MDTAEKLGEIDEDGFSTAFPINDLHENIFSIQASIWKEKGYNDITLWQKNRWDMISPTEPPVGEAPEVDVKMMRNEYRSAAFNISNAGGEVSEIRLSIRGLPGGDNPDFLEVHAGLFTDTVSGVPVMTALPKIERDENGYTIKINSGLTRQIWLTFNSKNLDAGLYKGEIIVEPYGIQVPVSLKVYPIDFPDKPRLHLGGWDYTNTRQIYNLTSNNRKELIDELKTHFVDTTWATKTTLGEGVYDKNGSMIVAPDTGMLAQWIKRWPDASNYFVFVNTEKSFGGFEIGSDQFNKAVADWIDFWGDVIKDKDFNQKNLGLLLVDEPKNKEMSERFISYASIISKRQPEIEIWEDVAYKEPWEAPNELFDLSDVLCIHLPGLLDSQERFANFYLEQQKSGKELWFYSAAPYAKLLDPYSYYRMQEWFCWKYNAKGSCFWSFIDSSGSSSWNEYLARGPGYTPLFLDDDSVTSSKHMEAIREGVEDYEYLSILSDKINALQKESKQNEIMINAERLLETAADLVTKEMKNSTPMKWMETKDRSVADEIIVEILDMLMELNRL
jgi:hypothetical protein